MPALWTPTAAKPGIAADQDTLPAASTRAAGYTYRYRNTMNADSQDNLILPTVPPAAIADDVTSTRSPQPQRHILQRNSWPTTIKSIQSA